MMVRLREADGSTRMHERGVCDPIVINEPYAYDDKFVYVKTRVFKGELWSFPPDWLGPIEHDDWTVEHDPPWRERMTRNLGGDAVRNVYGQSVEGWRLMKVYREVT